MRCEHVAVDSDEERQVIELAQLADVAAAENDWEHQVVDGIVGTHREDPDRQRLADAFRFHADHGEDRDRERFGPMVKFESGATIPAPLSEMPEETCTLWEAVAERATNSRVRARLHDLLFERRWGDVGTHAAAAIEAYLADAAPIDPPSLRTLDALGRAHNIAKMIRRSDLAERAMSDLLKAAATSLDDPEPKPGVALGLIEVLVENRCDNPVVDELLVRARRHYNDAWNTQNTIDLQRKRAPDATSRTALDRELVELWLDEADRVDPLVALSHREKAAKIARSRGLPDLAERAVLAMQAAEPPKLAHIKVEVPSSLTHEQIEEYIESMVGETWWESVARVLSVGPPTGDVEHNRKLSADLAKEHPLQALFPKVRLGGDCLPRYTPTSEEDRLDDQLTDIETMALRMQGQLLGEALRRAGARHSPSVEGVIEALRDVGWEGAPASAIARVVRRFDASDFEAAAYTGLPLIERLCRELLLSIDAPLYRVQRDRTPGTYPGLGALLPPLLERGLDPSWHRFLRTFLSAPNGWNFRNEALHGFVDDVNATGAALVLIAVLYLAHLRPQPVDPDVDETSPAGPG